MPLFPTLVAISLSQFDASAQPATNLLQGLSFKAEKVANAERMTDGKAADPGDGWQTALTSVIEKDGNVTWDLGASREFEGAWVQADNNDVYMLSTSEDGVNFTLAWESMTVDNAGMQVRQSAAAKGRGRYVRLTAKGGDGLFSVAEIGIFATPEALKAYVPSYVRTAPPPAPFDGNWIVIAVVLAGIVMLVRRMKSPEVAEGPKDAAKDAPKDEKKEEPPEAKG